MSQIVIVSGPPGAGKSTVCEALCERYDRTVHLQTDDAYGWIRMGFIQPWKPGSARQNFMVSRACARAATAFAAARYGVFIDGVIGPAHLPIYIDELRSAGVPVHYVVLLPSLEAVVQRAHDRDKQISGAAEMYSRVYPMFSEAKGQPGVTVDNGALTANQTADAVMEACGRGDALVWAPA
jgi:predicted ATPase